MKTKTTDIKTEIRLLIDNETDNGILETIRTLLEKSKLNPAIKKKLTLRALKSEEDIVSGRTMDRADLEQRLNQLMGI